MSSTRRQFLAALGVAGVSCSLSGNVHAEGTAGAEAEAQAGSIFDTGCVLQNPCPDSVRVVWTVNAPATGWVVWGTSAENLDQRATGSVYGLNPYSDEVIAVTLRGLRPNTRYYYRAMCAPVDFRGAYDIRPGEAEAGPVCTFETPGPDAQTASFCVINDTHERQELLDVLAGKIVGLKPDYVVWNGDLVNHIQNEGTIRRAILAPAARFGASAPLLVTRGNHDTRGVWARNFPRFLTPWNETDPKFADLGYNYVVRHGQLAIIGLDTGEDKPDFRREWGGLADFEQLIALQAEWLAEAVRSEAVRTAPFVVATCHIPLFDPRPDANPGTLETGYSAWKKLAMDLWGKTLRDAGIQLLIAAHVHRFRCDEPTEDRPWMQITGGGCTLNQDATVIHGVVQDGKLRVNVHAAATDAVLGTFTFAPRL